MKTMAKIITVILVIFLGFVAFVGFIDMPVAEEGEQLSKAEEIIVWLKTNLEKVLSATGLTLNAVLVWLMTAIQKSSNTAMTTSGATEQKLVDLNDKVDKMLTKEDTVVRQKMDYLMQMLSSTLLASEVPASVREKISTIKDEYDKITEKMDDTKQVVAEIKENLENLYEQSVKSNSTITQTSTNDTAVNNVVARI